jgi:hypothetical protein
MLMNDDMSLGVAAPATRETAHLAKSLLSASATQAASLPGSPRHLHATATIRRLSHELANTENVPPEIGVACLAQVATQVIRALCGQLGIEAAAYLDTVEVHLAHDVTSLDRREPPGSA